jgi:hypothetical protein
MISLLPLMDFIVNNQEHFQTNAASHGVRRKEETLSSQINFQLHMSSESACVDIFGDLPSSLRSCMSEKSQFRTNLHTYMLIMLC